MTLIIGFIVSSYFSMTTWEKWHDWQELSSTSNIRNTMTAKLESNSHFGSEGYKPIVQVSLIEKSGMRRVVWGSGEKSSPVLTWVSDTELKISYKHNLSSNYYPTVIVDGTEYTITLDMNLESDSIYKSSWNEWSWEEHSIIKNHSSEIKAIIERGEHNYDGAAPILRVSLLDSEGKSHEVWSGTEFSSKPIVSWIDASTLEISVIDLNSYSFYPAKNLDKHVYNVALKLR